MTFEELLEQLRCRHAEDIAAARLEGEKTHEDMELPSLQVTPPDSFAFPVIPSEKSSEGAKPDNAPAVLHLETPPVRDVSKSSSKASHAGDDDGLHAANFSAVSHASALSCFSDGKEIIQLAQRWISKPSSTQKGQRANNRLWSKTHSRIFGSQAKTTRYESFFISGSGRHLHRFVTVPSSTVRLIHELMGLFLIVYDFFWLPLRIFDIEGMAFHDVLEWMSVIYWTVDMPASFFNGYYDQKEGTIEMRIDKIISHYVRGMFFPDMVLIILDWGLLVLELQSGGMSYMRFAKSMRFFRLIRLMRLYKVHGRLADMLIHLRGALVQREAFWIMIGLIKILVFIIMINHMIACVWFAIGQAFPTQSWVIEAGVMDRDISYRYLTALHWSITQFTPASMEVYPQNSVERLFTIGIILSGMIAFSSFVSAITNAMTQLRNLNAERNEQLSKFRSYLMDNNVSGPLAARVHSSLAVAMQQSKRHVHEGEVVLLELLPPSLRQELAVEVRAPIIGSHAFLSFCGICYPVQSKKLCISGVKDLSLKPSYDLMMTGEPAKLMYFLRRGRLTYNREAAATKNNGEDVASDTSIVKAGSWLSEAALWLEFHHHGTAVSNTPCELMTLDVEILQDLFKCESTVRAYAKRFWNYFRDHPDELSDVWDDLRTIGDWTHEGCLEKRVNLATIEPSSPWTVNTRHPEKEQPKTGSRLSFAGRISISKRSQVFLTPGQ